MILTSLSILIYAAGTLASLAMTYSEGEQKGGQWDLMRVLGLALSFVWPVLIVGILAMLVSTNVKTRLVKN
jgi:hypothetical protein